MQFMRSGSSKTRPRGPACRIRRVSWARLCVEAQIKLLRFGEGEDVVLDVIIVRHSTVVPSKTGRTSD